jgi:hypothetical protein
MQIDDLSRQNSNGDGASTDESNILSSRPEWKLSGIEKELLKRK